MSNVPIFILAGGLGTRFAEETHLRPKPMIEIGDIPILLHIMRYYYQFGFNDFVICAGYRSWEIKDYFLNWNYRSHHLSIDYRNNVNEPPKGFGSNGSYDEKWRVRVIDTGLNTMTGGRLRLALDEIQKTDQFENFGLTYGDGLCSVNLKEEFNFHQQHGKIATMLGVPPLSRFGEIILGENNVVCDFLEKPENRHGLINGGYFFFKKDFLEYLPQDTQLVLEKNPLNGLAKERQLVVYEHRGFWQCMDTLRDKNLLQSLWDSGSAPWINNFDNVN